MHWKTTVVLLLVTVGLGAYISLYDLKQPTREAREREDRVLLNLPTADISQVQVAGPQGAYTLTRHESAWRVSPGEFRADTDLAEGLLAHARRLTAARILKPEEGKPLDLKAYGLAPALVTVTFTTSGLTSVLRLGEPTAVGSDRYAQLAGEPAVGIVAGQIFEDFNRTVEDLRDRRLARLESWDVREARLDSDAQHFHLVREEAGWALTEPQTDRADDTAVTQWLNQALFLRIERFLEPLPQGAADPAGLDRPNVAITLQPKAEGAAALVLTFGKPLAEDGKLLYAQRSDEPQRYAVAASAVEALLRDPHGLRSTACFEQLYPSQVSKVEITRAGVARSWELKDGAWVAAPEGPAPEPAAMAAWLEQVAAARFSGFIEEAPNTLARYGLEPAEEGTLSVWRKGEETPQQLLIGKPIDKTTNRYAKLGARPPIVRVPEDVTALLKPAWIPSSK